MDRTATIRQYRHLAAICRGSTFDPFDVQGPAREATSAARLNYMADQIERGREPGLAIFKEAVAKYPTA